MDKTLLLTQAKEVLDGNRINGYTKPTPKLYPFQWNWDAGFIAMGYAHYNMDYAESELRSLFKGQWKHGMVPQIIFHSTANTHYFPSVDFWETGRAVRAPRNVGTSGITMPPVHGFTLERIYQFASDKQRALNFVKEMYPKILALHRYLYQHRDPLEEGLVHIRHPWESGNDNSPTWDTALAHIDLTEIVLPPYQRKDLQNSHSEHRPTHRDYDCYVYLVDLFRKFHYDDKVIYEASPFAVQDPLFNCILVKSNQSLIKLGELIGEDASQIEAWNEKTIAAMNTKLWNEERGIYDAFDMYAGERIPILSSSGFMPLFAGVPSAAQAEKLYQRLCQPDFSGTPEKPLYFCPSYSTYDEKFDPKKYWRGPVWINMNWMLYHGLKQYGYDEKAAQVKADALELITRYGFYEYFEPEKENPEREIAGCGANHFSWTAALCIDFLESEAF